MRMVPAFDPVESQASREPWDGRGGGGGGGGGAASGGGDRRSSERKWGAAGPFNAPHRLEQAVQRRLLAHPELRFSSLVIRRIPNGVCLEGVLEMEVDLDLGDLVRSVAGVTQVLNHLVIHRSVTPY